ncbi:2-amino-4-hydroxy-6-hydroxymethyldihydropteridine diphosphokinase [Marinobacterium nitratireducens]|uniref:2-amino-4-hydroxy-6-hydroxymethyldihydropteridine diphosphokinase n=1 Tax=Marinobacterium nitratireducens TaxID=518897 RepID=A0A917ZLN6_9GAMM|nr:2-amino-4-hydroxy-6-hydroxymethyldihydropteridine diphosphokinase [Marinobacterium nitratireducens]GGO86413.1 2-amino-4-hydroxy-6-hydroxymethyldihydropteridine diphosphokinase [Marinobacterium nitratireducens]
MARVYVGIGSNIERARHVTAALDALADAFGELRVSTVFESEAVGFDGSPFYNLVAGFDTALGVGELSRTLKTIEDRNGRCRQGPKFSGRTLDIDILTYDDLSGSHDGIELPRAEILKNAFVLQPLAEIAPQERHPVDGRSYAELWDAYDKQKQRLWPVKFFWRGELISRTG